MKDHTLHQKNFVWQLGKDLVKKIAPDEIGIYDETAAYFIENDYQEDTHSTRHLSSDTTLQILMALNLIWPILLKYIENKVPNSEKKGNEVRILHDMQLQTKVLSLSIKTEILTSAQNSLIANNILQDYIDFTVKWIRLYFFDAQHIPNVEAYQPPVKSNTDAVSVLILTPLPVEYTSIVRHLESQGEPEVKEQMAYEKGTFKGKNHKYDIVICEPGKQNIPMALATEKSIKQYKPKIVLLIGIAGGVKDVRIGDVVVGNKAYGYESGKEGDGEFWTRPSVEPFSRDLLAHAQLWSRRDNWKKRTKEDAADTKVIFGPIAAGDKVIISRSNETFKRLTQNYNDTIALEMEAIGFATAIQAYREVHGLAIRGISDLLDHKSDDFQALAADRAAAFAFELLYELDGSDFLSNSAKNSPTAPNITIKNSKNIVIGGHLNPSGNIHIGDNIHNNPPIKTEQLINRAQEQLEKFYPETALILLNEAINPYITSSERANLEMLKGMCLYETNQAKEGEEAYLKAWNYCPDNIEYKAKALRVFMDRDDIIASQKLIDEIFIKESNNSVAWAAKAVLEKVNIVDIFNKLPWQITRQTAKLNDFKGRLSIFHKYEFDKLLEIYKEDIEKEDKIPNPNDITFSNKDYWLTVANILTAKVTFGYLLPPDGIHPRVKNNPLLIRAVKIFEAVFSRLDNTEKSKFIRKDYFFCNYAKYCISGSNEDANILLLSYADLMPNPKEEFTKIVAFVLCQTDQYENLYKFVSDKVSSSPGANLAKGTALAREGRIDEAKACFDFYIKQIRKIDENDFGVLLTFFEEILTPEDNKNEYLTLISEKTNDPITQKCILISAQWNEMDSEKRKQSIDDIYPSLDSEVANIYILTIGRFYLQNQNFDEAFAIFSQFVDFEVDTSEHYCYIETLYESHKDDTELLERIQNWRRKGFPKIQKWYHKEIQLLMLIPDWEEILEVTEKGIIEFPTDFYFLLLKLSALGHLGREKESIIEFERIKRLEMNEDLAVSFAEIIYKSGNAKASIELLYPFALLKENRAARKYYFLVGSMFGDEIWPKQPSTVIDNCWVLLESDDKVNWQRIKPSLHPNDWLNLLLGKLQGEQIEDKTPNIDITRRYIIKLIADELFGLFLQINDEILDGSPGLGLYPINLPNDNITDINKILIDLVGKQGEQITNERKNIFNNYQNQNIPFSQLVQYYDNDPVKTYQILSNPTGYGLWVIPHHLIGLKEDNLMEMNIGFSLDFSSLLLFQEIFDELKLSIKHTFSVSPLLIELLNNNFNKIKLFKPPEISLHVTTESVSPYLYPPNYKNIQIELYKKIETWIALNCRSIKDRNKIKLLGELLNLHPENYKRLITSTWFKYVLDTAYLAEKSKMNSILISDDTIFPSTFGISTNVISTEFYLRTFYHDDYELKVLPFLLKKNYSNLTISKAFLNEEFNKFLRNDENCYHNAIINIWSNTEILVDHLFVIYATQSKLIEQKRILSQHAMNSCFAKLTLDQKTITLLNAALKIRFKFLPDMVKYVLDDINIVLYRGFYF